MIGVDIDECRIEKPGVPRRRDPMDDVLELDHLTCEQGLLIRDAAMSILQTHHGWTQKRIAVAFNVKQSTVCRCIKAVKEAQKRMGIKS